MTDTCTFCKKKKICNPAVPYTGYCGWRETGPQNNPEKDDTNITEDK